MTALKTRYVAGSSHSINEPYCLVCQRSGKIELAPDSREAQGRILLYGSGKQWRVSVSPVSCC